MLLEPDMNTNHKTNEQLLDEIWRDLRKKDLNQAVRNSNLLTKEFPDFAPGWYAASHVAQLISQPESALTAIDRALDLGVKVVDHGQFIERDTMIKGRDMGVIFSFNVSVLYYPLFIQSLMVQNRPNSALCPLFSIPKTVTFLVQMVSYMLAFFV